MTSIWFVAGVILAAALLARIIRRRNRAEAMRDRNYFKRIHSHDGE